jgi:glycosyltransferase involved in cell wall biosynthesis
MFAPFSTEFTRSGPSNFRGAQPGKQTSTAMRGAFSLESLPQGGDLLPGAELVAGRCVPDNGLPQRQPEDKSTALVLIPARNEAATIGRVVRGCVSAGFSVEVIDDASHDATALLAAQAGAEAVILSGPHHGKTAALHHALARLPASVEWLIFLDGDGQHHPADLDRFWSVRAQADLVVGNRFPDAGRMPFLRRWTNCAMSALLRRSGIVDSQCGFRLVRRAWLGAWLPHGHHFQFETEMALFAAARGGRIVNLPIAATYGREESKIVPWRDALNFARCLLRSCGGR